jgi:transcriptional regulator with XRE-family HTH domain
MDTFAQNLRLRAQVLNMSNADVADLAKLDTRRYGHYVTGRSEPDLMTLCRIAEVLKTTPNELLGFGTIDTPPQIARLNAACQYLDEPQIEMLINFAEASLVKK